MNHPSPHDPSQSQEHRIGKIFQGFHELMRYRIRDIILVSSLYDLYVFEEDGRLYELIREEYRGLNLSHAPELTRVSSGKAALDLAKDEKRFDMIITTPHIEDMDVSRFARLVRNADLKIPLVLLTYDSRDTADLLTQYNVSLFDRVFIWQGDFRILIGIIKHIEDSLNVEHDTNAIGVQVVILVEDNVRFYSSYLPIIYTELFKQSTRLTSEGVSLTDRYIRMRARPKILLCTNYEDAWYYFEKYREHILGIISDVDFLHEGIQDPQAGIEFARNVKRLQYDVPILLQSHLQENETRARESGASFLLKDSPTLLNDLRQFMIDNFGFGDFVFRTSDNNEVARAHDLVSLEERLKTVPAESIKYHGDRNHFSNWLKARTEFWLAHKLRPRKVSDFESIEDLRTLLISSLSDYRKARQRGTITDFKKETFDPAGSFARIGGGSLGGKARGISFVNLLINNSDLRHQFAEITIRVPPAVVLGTDVFDNFMDENNLRSFALSATDDAEIVRRFLAADNKFPPEVCNQLRDFLDIMRKPLAVRSSSLLEDSQYYPFAGVYETYMIPNNNPDPERRLWELLNTIKCVYASTFYNHAKDYIKVTTYRLEEEKMAVIIQKMVGSYHENRFYPDFAGVAKSHNFYPVPPQKSSDGIISVALGLGKTVVEGGNAVRFCSKYPNHIPQFSTIEETLKHNQQTFYALNLEAPLPADIGSYDNLVQEYPLEIAEKDGSLYHVGSTYSHANHAVYDGLSRKGTRLVTFAPILKNKIFPFPEILELLLEMGRKGMGTPIEIEFAVNMSAEPGKQKEFGVLQMRPLVLSREPDQLRIEKTSDSKLICKSNRVLGNGLVNNIHDVVMVDYEHFNRAKSHDVAREVYYFNAKLLSQKRPYLLIGVGRWGSLDPWLGIPVRWEQISGAKAIVEAGFKDIDITPSQGSHFFQNITSFMIGYFTVDSFDEHCFLDWKWLQKQPVFEELEYTRHLRFENPIMIKMNGHKQKGIILKPEA